MNKPKTGRTGPSNLCGISIRKYMMGIAGNLKSGTLGDTRSKKIVPSEKNPKKKWDKVVIFRGWNSPTPTDKSPCTLLARNEQRISDVIFWTRKYVAILQISLPPPLIEYGRPIVTIETGSQRAKPVPDRAF